MAKSPAHRFGQIIGELLESAIYPFLQNFAAEHGYYLDRSVADAARAAKMETRHLHDIIYRIREDKEIRLSTFGRIIESARGRKP